MPKRIDLTGINVGTLTVISYYGYENRLTFWKCYCNNCKREKVICSMVLRGKIKSCGCLRNIKHRHTTKGISTNEFNIWSGMKARCNNPTHKLYPRYGARGIKVCDRWVNSFQNFYDDMGNKPKGHSLDRINVNGNYDPSNCRWADWITQNRNKTSTVFIELEGKRLSVCDWSDISKISPRIIKNRYFKGGINAYLSIFAPKSTKHKLLKSHWLNIK